MKLIKVTKKADALDYTDEFRSKLGKWESDISKASKMTNEVRKILSNFRRQFRWDQCTEDEKRFVKMINIAGDSNDTTWFNVDDLFQLIERNKK